MYSCEKLARGTSGGILKSGRVRDPQSVRLPSGTLSEKRSYFGNANVYSVIQEKDVHRPQGKLYCTKMK